jgi:hypothetical protein
METKERFATQGSTKRLSPDRTMAMLKQALDIPLVKRYLQRVDNQRHGIAGVEAVRMGGMR